MHIGFLTPEYLMPGQTPGGLASYVRKTALALIARGHQVSVFVVTGRDAQWQDTGVSIHEVRSTVWPYRLHRLGAAALTPMAVHYFTAQRVAASLWRVHAQTPFDLLQTADYRAPGFALRHNGRVPLVCRISSYTPLWRAAYGHPRSLGDHLLDWLEIRQVVDADSSFAPSRLLADTFARFEAVTPTVIRTPIDAHPTITDDSYYRAHFHGQRYLLYFGSMSRIKGTDLLADALPPILAEHPELTVGFVGADHRLPNGRSVAAYLQERCGPCADRLHFHPWLPKAQLYPIVANAIAALMPSRVDNYPNVCLEGQMLGVPVVGTYGSSLDEMIADSHTGFLAQRDDPTDFARALRRLLALTPEERQRMQANIHAEMDKVRQEDRIGQLLAYYEQVITQWRATHAAPPLTTTTQVNASA